MSDTTPQVSQTNSAGPTPDLEVQRNGSAGPAATSETGSAGSSEQRPGMERAEAIVDRVAERVANLANTAVGKKLLTLAAHVREAAQDFWAEVQQVRQGKRP
jgi:hypothetical protein